MDLIEILNERLEKGEITLVQYEKMHTALHDSAASSNPKNQSALQESHALPPPNIFPSSSIKSRIIWFFIAAAIVVSVALILITLGLPRFVVVVLGIFLLKYLTKSCWE